MLVIPLKRVITERSEEPPHLHLVLLLLLLLLLL